MFSVGDLVVHPMHGAGVIDAIVQEKVAGSTQDYYVFKMPVGGLLLKIPTANSQTIGVRSVIQRPEAEALIAAIPSLAVEESSNWNKRYRENLLRMKSGDLYEVARDVPGTEAGPLQWGAEDASYGPPDPAVGAGAGRGQRL